MDTLAFRRPEADPDRIDLRALDGGIERALAWLDEHQHADGYWVGMLESNRCMEAEWLLAMHFLGIDDDPKKPGLIRCILHAQRADGAWETYHDAPTGDINTTVECYAALRSTGMPADAEPLARARAWIFKHDALRHIRVFTRYWLALVGEWPWEKTPNLPPEIIFFPSWFPFNIYNFASWARATLVPLCIVSARRAVRRLPPESRLDELFPDGRENADYNLPPRRGGLWEIFFRNTDRLLHVYQSISKTPGREVAIKRCLEWIVRHQEADGAWCGIQPPWIYGLMALHAEGYGLHHPVMATGLAALDAHWSYERDGHIYIQASESVVWDTLLSLLAMHDCGRRVDEHPIMQQAVEWVLAQQVHEPGDWQVKLPGVEPGGWAFERANVYYPDVDDTALALIVLALLRPSHPDKPRLDEAMRRAKDWVLAMQSRNGGWAAFDRDNDLAVLTKLPFCDFGEALDPPSADVTAHVLEALGLLGVERSHPAAQRALAYVLDEQEPEGSWFGRWGVNHIYGTAAVLPALKAIGEDMSSSAVRRAAGWIVDHQNPDGGWGETCASYMDDSLRGKGESTASQTGWALMALTAVGGSEYREVIERGVSHLLARQWEGTWDEPHFTGTGFPGYGLGARTDLQQTGLSERLRQGPELARGFMINYNLYRHYFPLMALGRARRYLAALYS